MILRILITLLVLSPSVSDAGWYEIDTTLMGTEVHLSAWHERDQQARLAVEDALTEMRRIDALMSTYEPSSELSLLNRVASRQATVVSAELLDLISRSLEISHNTRGAFDVTYASVGYLYDYRAGIRPESSDIQAQLPAVNYQHVVVNEQAKTIAYSHPDVRVDLGGIAKGYAVDRSIEILKQHGVQNAIVTAGGDTRVLGKKLDRPWVVGIQNPRSEKEVVAVIPLVNESISTSGDYERYFDEQGIRYHHIIDPKTGDSAREVRSVSILGEESTYADALSTSLFVLGLDSGMQLINTIQGYEAILVDREGQLHYSKGLQQFAKQDQQHDALTGKVSQLVNQ